MLAIRIKPHLLRWAVLVVPVVVGCGSGTSSDSSKDAGSGGMAGATSAGGAAGLDAGVPGDATDDADAPASLCVGPPDGGALSAPVVVASGRSFVNGIGTSKYGVLWWEGDSQVWLGTEPPTKLFGWDTTFAASFHAARNWYAMPYDTLDYSSDPSGLPTFNPNGSISIGNVTSGVVWTCMLYRSGFQGCVDGAGLLNGSGGTFDDLALDDTNIYVLWTPSDAPWTPLVTVAPLHSPSSTSTSYDVGPNIAAAIAVDDTRIYVLVFDQAGVWSVEAMPKTGGAFVPLATALPTEPPFAASPLELIARHGSVMWTFAQYDLQAHTPYQKVRVVGAGSSSVRILFDDRDMAGIAMDDEYVYWTSDSSVKRIRICGGTPEVIAENQGQTGSIAVDDHAVYWLRDGSYNDGKVMRMWKSGAPGYLDAGTDASTVDASGDGGISASDAGFGG